MTTRTVTPTPQSSSGPEGVASMEDVDMSTHSTTPAQQSSFGPKLSTDVEDADTSGAAHPCKRVRPLETSPGSSTLVEDMQRLLATQPSQIQLDEQGSPTIICFQEKAIDFRPVGIAAEMILLTIVQDQYNAPPGWSAVGGEGIDSRQTRSGASQPVGRT
ncbi:hypothetical protein BGX30_014906 [Mortierella sp. GBA39]|nr:hypothetical protein BGX30_014906 [Mortierella sp. GBA39]